MLVESVGSEVCSLQLSIGGWLYSLVKCGEDREEAGPGQATGCREVGERSAYGL